jgi:hypothetical protein
MSLRDRDRLDPGKSDSEIVTAALERQIVAVSLAEAWPHDSKSVFIRLTTATLPVRVEIDNDDWTCRFVFDLPHVHRDGTVEYRVKR